jgi:hypothetical protein
MSLCQCLLEDLDREEGSHLTLQRALLVETFTREIVGGGEDGRR